MGEIEIDDCSSFTIDFCNAELKKLRDFQEEYKQTKKRHISIAKVVKYMVKAYKMEETK